MIFFKTALAALRRDPRVDRLSETVEQNYKNLCDGQASILEKQDEHEQRLTFSGQQQHSMRQRVSALSNKINQRLRKQDRGPQTATAGDLYNMLASLQGRVEKLEEENRQLVPFLQREHKALASIKGRLTKMERKWKEWEE